MKVKSLAVTLALCLAGAAVSLAQDPQIGTWKINEAKSKVPSGYMKNTTVTYTMEGDNTKVTTDGIGKDGKPLHTEWTGKFDGKDYPLTGDPGADTRAYTRVDDHTLTMANKMGGKPITTGRIVVAPDGKSRTVSTTGPDSSGQKASATSVYDKQ